MVNALVPKIRQRSAGDASFKLWACRLYRPTGAIRHPNEVAYLIQKALDGH